MKLAFATRWGQPCGISTYCEQLAGALHKAGHDITVWGPALFGQASSNPRHVPGGIPVEYVWFNERDTAGAAAHNIGTFTKLAQRDKPDLVHVQHEYGLWGNNDSFLQQLRALREAGPRVVVTLHTVFPYGGYDNRTGFFDRLRHFTDAIVVHTPHAYAALEMGRGPAPVYLVPHGTPEEEEGSFERGREFLGLKNDGVVGVVFGFIGQNKNIVGTIFTFVEGIIRRWIPADTKLVIVGECSDVLYIRNLEGCIDATGYSPCIRLLHKFVPVDTVKHVMAAADFAVLNTTADTLSASGAVHAHAAHGVPLAVADKPIYHDAKAYGALSFDHDKYVLQKPTLSAISAVSVLARSERAREVVAAGMRRLADETRWSKLVPTYEKLYKEICS